MLTLNTRAGDDAVIDDIKQLISEYVGSMGKGTALAAAYYDVPAFFAGPASFEVLNDRTEIATAFERLLAPLRPSGYSHSTCKIVHVRMLNPAMALCGSITTRWANDIELQRSGVTYLLYRGESGWKIRQLMVTDIATLTGQAASP